MTQEMLEYCVPVPPRRSGEGAAHLKKLSTVQGTTIGFIVNSFDCSKTFFDELGKQLTGRFGVSECITRHKREKSYPAEPEVFDYLRDHCDAVVDGVQI
jgi:hypothetical protein